MRRAHFIWRPFCWLLGGHAWLHLTLRQAYGPIIVTVYDLTPYPALKECQRCGHRVLSVDGPPPPRTPFPDEQEFGELQ